MDISLLTSKNRERFLDFAWGNITWLASSEIGNSETMTLGRVKIRAGQANPRHYHPNCDEILLVISGRLEHSLGDQRAVLEPGQAISIPAGVAHNAAALGSVDAEMIICFSSAHRETVGEDAASQRSEDPRL